jgi:hypothetical protein
LHIAGTVVLGDFDMLCELLSYGTGVEGHER